MERSVCDLELMFGNDRNGIHLECLQLAPRPNASNRAKLFSVCRALNVKKRKKNACLYRCCN